MADQAMTQSDNTLSKQGLIQAILDALPRSLMEEHRAQLSAFIPDYFDNAPTEELSTSSVEDLAGAALSHWQLARNLGQNDQQHSIFNPAFESHGWMSVHTVIQIVAKDQPWLVSSLQAGLTQNGHTVHRLIHPVISVQRTSEGQWLSDRAGEHKQSLIFIEIDAIEPAKHAQLGQLIDNLFNTLAVIRTDKIALREQLDAMADALGDTEQAQFVRWLDDRQFACLGHAKLRADDGFSELYERLGILAENTGIDPQCTSELLPEGLEPATLIKRFAQDSLIVCKSGLCSPVIRDEPADLIIHVQRDANGQPTQLDCIVGLFIAGLQSEAISNIPWMRERVERVIQASGTVADSHVGKAITATLRGLPRDMLMQTRSHELLEMANGIVALQERQQVRLFSSSDALGRFCNCLVYIPRDAYSREIRLSIEQILITHTDGISAGFDTRFSSESALARLHFVIQKNPPFDRRINWASIEQRIRNAAITWTDRLESTLRENHDEISAIKLLRRYATAFPSGYCEDYSARAAAADIDFIENHLPPDAPVMSFYRHIVADTGTINFKLFAMNQPVSLSDVIPIIENMGLRVESEQPFEIRRHDAPNVWMHEFTVQQTGHTETDASGDTAQRIQNAFDHIWRGEVENDGFNRLMIDAALDWRQVVLLRALCKYLLQIDVPFSQTYMIDSLVANAPITRLLVELFEMRFKPGASAGLTHEMSTLLDEIGVQLDDIVSLDEDRILRGYRNIILATLRTNAYRTDSNGERRDFLSFKFDSAVEPVTASLERYEQLVQRLIPNE